MQFSKFINYSTEYCNLMHEMIDNLNADYYRMAKANPSFIHQLSLNQDKTNQLISCL